MDRSQASPSIRRGATGDNVLLAELGAETFRDAFGPQNTAQDMAIYLAKSFSPEIQANELADPGTVFLIAEVGGEPVGYVRLREGAPATEVDSSRPVEIVRFYARNDWIGKGVGSALMQASLLEARTLGHDLVWLDVWEENERAIGFYRKWGFEEIGSQPFLLGNDLQKDLLMARAVADPGMK